MTKNIKNVNHLKSNPLSYENIVLGDKKQETTCFNDFRIAELFGTNAIRETFDNLKLSFGEPESNMMYWIELINTVNTLCWLHYKWENKDYSSLYSDLYMKARCLYLESAEKNGCDRMMELYYQYID